MVLKEKGDTFYRSGDMQGAVSAYSEAVSMIQEWPTLDATGLLLLSCYSNRSACYLRLAKWSAFLDSVPIATHKKKHRCKKNVFS